MFKNLLTDYISNFPLKLKEMAKSSSGVIIIAAAVLLMFLPFTVVRNSTPEYYFGSLIPAGAAFLLSVMYGGRLDKTFFLCPLDKKAAKKYYILSYLLRSGFCAVIRIIFNFVLFGADRMILSDNVLLISDLLFIFAINVYRSPDVLLNGTKEKRLLPAAYRFLRTMLIVCEIIKLVLVSLLYVRTTGLFYSLIVMNALFFIVVPLESVLFLIIMIRHMMPVLRHSTEYEEGI